MPRPKVVSRLETLEARLQPKVTRLIRYGWTTRLPADYTGERHVVVVKRTPGGSPNFEWCEFEERPGPAPGKADHKNFEIHLTR